MRHSHILILVLVLFGCQPTQTPADQSGNSESEIPVMTVRLKGKSLDTMNLKELNIIVQHFKIESGGWQMDTLMFDSNGIANYAHPYPGIKISLIMAKEQYLWVEMILHKGLELNVDFDAWSDSTQITLHQGIGFHGADSAQSSFFQDYRAFKHPFKDSFYQAKQLLKQHGREFSKMRRKQRLDSVYYLNQAISDAFCVEYDCTDDDEEWLRSISELEKCGLLFRLHIDSALGEDELQAGLNLPIPFYGSEAMNVGMFYKYALLTAQRSKIENELINFLKDKGNFTKMDSSYLALTLTDDLNVDESRKATRLFWKMMSTYKKEMSLTIENTYISSLEKGPSFNADLYKMTYGAGNSVDRYYYLQSALPTFKTDFLTDMAERELAEMESSVKEINRYVSNRNIEGMNPELGVPVNQFSFGAKLYETKHDSLSSLMDALNQHFKGRSVVFDIWATWCAPCRKDMKESKPVKKQLENEPIEFVYFCMGGHSSVPNWQEAIGQLGTGGTHFFVHDVLIEQVKSHFKVTSYPTYVFANTEGDYDFEYIRRIARIDIEDIKKRL